MEYAIHFQLPSLKDINVEFIDALNAEEALSIFNRAKIKDAYNVTVSKRLNVWDSLAKRHGLEKYCTGGNCEAYRLTFNDGSECLIVDAIDSVLPSDGEDVSLYFYDTNGFEVADFQNMDGTPLEQWETIDGIISGYELRNKCERIN